MTASFSPERMEQATCDPLDTAAPGVDPAMGADGKPPTGTRAFDVIIVGGNSYGALLAHQLRALDPTCSRRILILETEPRLPGAPGPIWAAPQHARPARPTGLCGGVGAPGAVISTGDWAPRPLDRDAADSELPRDRWPAALVHDLNRIYFHQARRQAGPPPADRFCYGALHRVLRGRLFAGLAMGRISNAYPLAELPDHPAWPGTGTGAPENLARPPGGTAPGDGVAQRKLRNLLKLEAPPAVEAPPACSGGRAAGGLAGPAHLTILPQCQVTRLGTRIVAGKTQVTEVQVLVGGVAHTLPVAEQGVVVLALDAVESARLALLSFPALPNRNLIGRNLLAHLRSSLTIRLPRPALPADLPTGQQAAALFVKGRQRGPTGVRHFQLQITALSPAMPPSGSAEALCKKIAGQYPLAGLPPADAPPVVLTIRGLGEMEPQNPASRVTLAAELDEHGYPGAWAQLTPTVQDLELWDTMDQAADEVARVFAAGQPYEVLVGNQFQPVGAAQATRTVLPFPDRRDRPGAPYPVAGTLWLGDDPNTSVTDSAGRFHYVANAYALGPCLLPTLGSSGLSLICTALVHRLADHLAARARSCPVRDGQPPGDTPTRGGAGSA